MARSPHGRTQSDVEQNQNGEDTSGMALSRSVTKIPAFWHGTMGMKPA
jgi:lysophospholipid acyltransferase (LPLAT)-like uncharacterized protein